MAKLGLNEIEITVLPDGRVRIETGSIGGPEHMAAGKMLAWLEAELGGEVVHERTEKVHHHDPDHEHEHEHEHDLLKH